jgi:4-amino-4-deoxy-L-arabinose transferase-like glycosyltransferase
MSSLFLKAGGGAMATKTEITTSYMKPLTRDYVALGLALLAFCLHAVFAGRYDVFRDELYFIVCGRHPAFGYADQPPLVPLLSALFYGMGHSVWLLRLPATLAAAALVGLSVRFARLLGGGDFAAVLAGLATMIAPMLMGMASVFSTTSFDPLAWTLIAYLLVRAVRDEDRVALLWCGVVAGLDLEAKYALPF